MRGRGNRKLTWHSGDEPEGLEDRLPGGGMREGQKKAYLALLRRTEGPEDRLPVGGMRGRGNRKLTLHSGDEPEGLKTDCQGEG